MSRPHRTGDRAGPRLRLAVAVVALSLLAAACSGGAAGESAGDGPAAPTSRSGDQADRATGETGEGSGVAAADGDGRTSPIELAARPGPFQLTIDEVPPTVDPAAAIEVLDGDGRSLATARVVDGSAVVRDLPPGPVEVVLTGPDGRRHRSQPIDIPGEAPDDPSAYDGIRLEPGFTYIPTRDGTTLSATITLPGPPDRGPYPVLVEYSGYAPSDPDATDPYRALIPTLGYGLVQVNVRGTGCSGGSFDAFERIQSLDGYDVIETVARQPWAGAVGMFGVSYPGIMQLHVASTRPPSLAAITPLSVTDGVDSVLYPGGIYNDGFGEEWTRQVGERARAGGQRWAADRIAGGDTICGANQALRVHNPDLVELVKANPYVDELSRSRSARTHAPEIEVPTFLAGAWQDEQTGGRFPALIPELDGAPVLRAVLYNGLHVDAVSATLLVRLIEFLDLYVARRPPQLDPGTRFLIEFGLSTLFGTQLELPPGRYDGLTVAEARAAFEAEPEVEVLFEQGAGQPNLPVPSFTAAFASWPPPAAAPLELYLAGTASRPVLATEPPADELVVGFETDPAEGQRTTSDDLARIWSSRPGWDWPAPDPGHAVVATSTPFAADTVLVGDLSADLWVSLPDGGDADLEVTVSEVAPDGAETYVQSGWLRLSRRALGDEATGTRPAISGLEADVAPLRPGAAPVLARVEVLPFAHAFRRGSSLRLTVDTPGASRPQWRFDVADQPVEVLVHSSPELPSRLVLPVVDGIDVPSERPACGTLRGQPCRPPAGR